MRRWAYFRYIMLPQMWIESLPALVNEMSFLIKGSPAIAVIGVVDLTRVTNRFLRSPMSRFRRFWRRVCCTW
jgi:polar amino acid transport system permease protein